MGKPTVRGLRRHPAATLDHRDVAELLEAIVDHLPDMLDPAQGDIRTVVGTLVEIGRERPLGARDLEWCAAELRRRQP